MSQPSYVPISPAGEVRPSMKTQNPEIGRVPKKGLLGAPRVNSGANAGTPAPNEGFAFTVAERVLAKFKFEHEHDRHNVVTAVALLAGKRASVSGRAPTLNDIHAVMAEFELTGSKISAAQGAEFAGLAHSYPAQRNFVDLH
ncbi:MAG: hypothetical protein WCL17_00675 [Actinomycetota bacterium]